VVPPDSHTITGVACYSGNNTPARAAYIYRALTVYGAASQRTSTSHTTHRPRINSYVTTAPTTPAPQPLSGLTRNGFSLIRFRSPLLSESQLFSLPAGTEMFHFPAFPPRTLCVQMRVTGHNSSWVTPFGNPRINARLPTPQGISQAPTSFIGSRCQGIHHAPLPTCQTNTQQTQHTRTPTHRADIRAAKTHTTNAKDTHRPTPNTRSHLRASICSRPLSRYQTTRGQSPPLLTAPDPSDTQQRATSHASFVSFHLRTPQLTPDHSGRQASR
jgi:hypothetical protein